MKSQHMECTSQEYGITVKIETGNAAMQTPEDISEALQRVAAKVALASTPCDDGKVLDRNGNTVGFWTINLLETDDDSEGC